MKNAVVLKKFMLNALIVLGLSACSSVVELKYYQLPVPAAASVNAVSHDAPVLIVEPVMVANYLNTNALILQTSQVELHRTQQHQWLEALDQQLNRILVSELQAKLTNMSVTTAEFAVKSATPSAQRLVVQIAEFHGTEQGIIILSGRYSWLGGSEGGVQLRQFRIELPQPEEGYPSMVQTMGAAVSKLSEQIAEQLQSHQQSSQLTPSASK
jgi:uncharacterized lipoprotein YmbA